MNHWLPWALWISEAWYQAWLFGPCSRISDRARAVVIYDRILNGRFADGHFAAELPAAERK